jgi:transposase-like protein
MLKRHGISAEEKIAAVEKYKRGESSQGELAREYGVSKASFQQWLAIYESQGAARLKGEGKNQSYTKELKRQAVEDYLHGVGSQQELCKKHQIRSKTQLQRWVLLYHGHKELRSTGGGERGDHMAKGRKTTLEERIEITSFCLENGKDYALTLRTFNVSYNQVYGWVKKYETEGIQALEDRRGRAKPEEKMTELDRVRAENRLLQAKLRDAQMENALLKKVQELERGGL